MDATPHPVATEHLPSFITAPGQTDVLMVIMVFVLAGAVLGFGILFLRLHSLPGQIAHKSQKLQAELVAVLCLVSLLTHMHSVSICGRGLALVEMPDAGTPRHRRGGWAEKPAGFGRGEGLGELPRPAFAGHGHGHGEETREAAAIHAEAGTK